MPSIWKAAQKPVCSLTSMGTTLKKLALGFRIPGSETTTHIFGPCPISLASEKNRFAQSKVINLISIMFLCTPQSYMFGVMICNFVVFNATTLPQENMPQIIEKNFGYIDGLTAVPKSMM